MSTFKSTTVQCPHCGHSQTASLASSINANRAPELRAALLARTFQRMACAECDKRYVADGPFLYMDFERKHWFGHYPLAWERRWRSLEAEPQQAWHRNMVVHAPPLVREQAAGFLIRAVFGLEAMREKLVIADAGLSDTLVEVAKLQLARHTPGLTLSPSTRLRLDRVQDGDLVFAVPARPGLRAVMPAANWATLIMDVVEQAPALEAVSGGPYVDVGRVVIGG